MPFSIDPLSVAAEAQKIILSVNSEDIIPEDASIYQTKDLVEQDPITVF